MTLTSHHSSVASDDGKEEVISISYTGGEKGSQDAIEQARIGRGSSRVVLEAVG